MLSFYTASVNFRTDGRPVCCPYYFPKGNTCEGMFNILPKILKKVTYCYLRRGFTLCLFFFFFKLRTVCGNIETAT